MEIKGVFYFDPSDKIYKDHFPANPIVPGSVVTGAFLEQAKGAGLSGDGCTLRDFRFREFVTPGEYEFSIRVVVNGIECRLYRAADHGSKALVTGIIDG